MKNYQQALHDADVLCRSKPHWPAVRCSPLAEAKMKTASARGFSLCQGQCCWGCCWKNIVALTGPKMSRVLQRTSLEGPQDLSSWWDFGGGQLVVWFCSCWCLLSATACAAAWHQNQFIRLQQPRMALQDPLGCCVPRKHVALTAC